MAVPALVGYGLALQNFGDIKEAQRLQAHRAFYQKEMANYKQELYYS